MHWKKTVNTPCFLVDFISQNSGLSKSETKKALTFGGGWVRAAHQKKPKRVRRATLALKVGDEVAFYYKATLLRAKLSAPEPIQETHHWGVWYKPVNVPSQGTPYGDKGCMEAQVQALRPKQKIHLVHRLDREASGLMLLAYSKKAAAALSTIWPSRQVAKRYWVKVLGAPTQTQGAICDPLDGKPATSHYQVTARNKNTSELEVSIETGRYHQIRRHMDGLGHPVLGDPKYGLGNQHPSGLHLKAIHLSFTCPLSGKPQDIALPDSYLSG